MSDPFQNVSGSFVKAEPVIAAHTAAAVVGYVLSLLVTHGVISGVHASAVTQQTVSIVTAGLIMLLGVLVRRFVSPAAAFAGRVEHAVAVRLGVPVAAPVAAPAVPAAPDVSAAPTPAAPVAPAAPAAPVVTPDPVPTAGTVAPDEPPALALPVSVPPTV